MAKNFKQMYSDEENWNNIKYWDNTNEVDYVQNDPRNMDTFLNLEDTFIESKKNYAGKMWSNVIVWRKERHLEINRFNYMTAHIEPSATELSTYINQVWFSYDSNMNQKARFVEQAEFGNFKKVRILKDWLYRLMHKEELDLDANDRELYSYINRQRGNDNTPLCVYHIQWNYSKSFSVSWWAWGSVSVKATLWEMHPIITGYCSLYSELKKWDILEYKIMWNKTNLVDSNRVDISWQVRQWCNVWQVEYVNFAFDDLNKWIKQHLVPLQ
jgi:hypothetical protein